MKHITEASDHELARVLYEHDPLWGVSWRELREMGQGKRWLARVATLRAAFDFSPPQPTEGVAELIDKMHRMSSAVYLATDESVARDISETLKLAIVALSTQLVPSVPPVTREQLVKLFDTIDDLHDFGSGDVASTTEYVDAVLSLLSAQLVPSAVPSDEGLLNAQRRVIEFVRASDLRSTSSFMDVLDSAFPEVAALSTPKEN